MNSSGAGFTPRTMKVKLILFLTFLLALSLRLLYWPEGITFHYDQARDAVLVLPIWQGEDLIKLTGPSAIIPGLAAGPLFYYLLSPAYFFGKGNPAFPSLLLIFLNSLAVTLVYYLAILLFNKRKIALLSSFLFAVSFEATQVARWLSNPSPAILGLLLAFIGFWQMIEGKKPGLLLAGLGAGLVTHLDLYFFYLFFLGLLYPFIFKIKIKKKIWFYYFLIFFCFLSPTILQQLKNNFLGVRSSFQFLFGVFKGGEKQFVFPLIYFKNFLKIFKNNFFFHPLVAALIGFLLLLKNILFCFKEPKRKERPAVLFLLIWLFSTLPLHIFDIDPVTAGYINVGINISAILLFSFWLCSFKMARGIRNLLLVLVFLSNLYLVIKENKNGNVLFSVQEKMTLGDQLKVIDYTYQSSGGKEFSINTLTLPLNINLLWEYHYWWYGERKYAYLPVFTGSPQFGWHQMKWSSEKKELHYTISEPKRGIARYFVDYFFGTEGENTKLLEEKKFGNFIVQKRTLKR